MCRCRCRTRGFRNLRISKLREISRQIDGNDLRGGRGRFVSLSTRLKRTPTPSKTPKRIPQATAEPKAPRGPPCIYSVNVNVMKSRWDVLRAAKQPPVKNPDMMAFHASSFCRHPLTAQSKVENIPPHTPKLPPVTGARAFITEIAPTRRSP